jgi:glyoxylase-like metal-dependent hydrolase (beta-lactamase superfamily II)
MSAQPIIRAFFDEPTNTVSYLVADPATKQAAVLDPVLDDDHNAGEVDTRSVEAILRAAQEADYTILRALETQAHADHLSGSPLIKAKTGAKIGIGEHIKDVQRIFRPVFNATDLKTDSSDFDHLFRDGERFRIGQLVATGLFGTWTLTSSTVAEAAIKPGVDVSQIEFKARTNLQSFDDKYQRNIGVLDTFAAS